MRRRGLTIALSVLLVLLLWQIIPARLEDTPSKATISIPPRADCATKPVHTTSGLVCGLEYEVKEFETGHEKAISAFLSIPYAQTTAGENRWQRPRPIKDWSAELHSDIFRATRFGPSCPQKRRPGVELEFSEDCLSLSVWTPVPLQETATADPRPVMVFIYGGSFKEGTSTNPLTNGSRLAATGDVVVVTLNYRVGALGFLSGTDNLNGNYGLLDQRLALRWVRDNISVFGGDPDNVALFGESAGAMSVGLHLISPESEPLFHAAILESNPYGLPYKSLSTSRRFARILKYNLGCAFRGLDCLRSKSFQDVVANQDAGLLPAASIVTGLSASLIWAPIIDGKQISTQPNVTSITKPVIVGTNLDEGIIFAVSSQKSLPGEDKKGVPKSDYERMLDVMYSVKTAERIKDVPRYKPHDGDNTDVFSHVVTDYLFSCANRNVMELATGPVWGYEFTHPPSYNVWPEIEECAPSNDTVCHAAELPFVFGNPQTAQIQAKRVPHTFSDDEKRLSTQVMRYWSKFAKTHDPNTDGNPDWPKFTKEAPVRQILDTKVSNTSEFEANCAFWNEVGYNEPGLLGRIFRLGRSEEE